MSLERKVILSFLRSPRSSPAPRPSPRGGSRRGGSGPRTSPTAITPARSSSKDEFLAGAAQLKTQGYMRRMAAVLHHRGAGFRANAMGVWVVPDDRAEDVGRVMGSFKSVSPCYLRPTYADWPYNIFTMVHGQDAKGCQDVIDAMAKATGITEYALLYSTREYKKIRLRYFTPELDEWEARARRSSVPAGTPL